MSHMVIYRGADGSPGYHQADEIHDAVAFVERLRNEQNVEGARIFRMEQVNFEYRPYFRVELTTGEPALASVPSSPAVAPAPAPSADPVLDVVETSQAAPSNDDIFTATEPKPDASGEAPAARPFSEPASDDNGVGARRGLFGR